LLDQEKIRERLVEVLGINSGRNRPGLKFFGLGKQQLNAPADNKGMTTPRQMIPGETIMITRRISERRFFLRPDRNVNNIVEFCIGLAAKKHGVLLHVLTVLTNHYHLEATDPDGNLPDFMRDANRTIAQCLNRYWNRDEALWSSDKPNVVALLDSGSQLAKIVYIAVNPVRALLVSDHQQWPGVIFTPRDWLRGGKTVKRPKYFFDADDPDTEEVTLTFVPPPAFADRDTRQLVREIEDTIRTEQYTIRVQVAAKGERFMGVKRILKVNPFDSPTTKEPTNKLTPRLSASDSEVMKKGQMRLKYFRDAYRKALKQLRAGMEAIFPYGTFWYKRLLNVPCEPAHTMRI
jgi:putative transposase